MSERLRDESIVAIIERDAKRSQTIVPLSSAPRWLRWLVPSALAAGFVILLLIGPAGGLRPTIASTQGEVQILRDGQRIPADTGGQIRPGERIRTGPNASAELRLADGTSIRMDGSTDVGFLPGKAARQVQVKTGMVHCDVAIEVELSAAAKVDGDSTPPADPASERNPNWSLQIAVDGDSFDGYRVVFAAPKYPNGIGVDSIHPVEWMLLARDPRPMPEAGDHTLRVEKRGSQLRVWVDRELRIDTALSYPLAPGRKQTFALSEFGTGPLIRSLRVWRGGRD